jgi:3-oxoacyl-[acyl-carrier-protein] synthase-1
MHRTVQTDQVCITGLGMITPLALDAPNTCAAARAGILRLRELNVMTFAGNQSWGGKPGTGFTVPVIANGAVGFCKALLLGRWALEDLLNSVCLSSRDLVRSGLYLTVSDQFLLDTYSASQGNNNGDFPSRVWKRECTDFLPKLLETRQVPIPAVNQRLSFGSHTSAVADLQDATAEIRLGKIDRCIVGGIDSCVEPRFMKAAAGLGLLKTAVNPVGFLPGEAAAFFLIETLGAAQARSAAIYCSVSAADYDSGDCTRFSGDPPTGIALARTLTAGIQRSMEGGSLIGSITGDLNGDQYRAKDWGYALVRLRDNNLIADLPLSLPAIVFGETGAASGALSICLGAAAKQRKCSPPGVAIHWFSSDNGSRSALCLDAVDS